jgi:hypothetical protein
MHDSMDYEGRGSRTAGSLSGAMAGFALGAIVGAGLALLFAPAPGAETRRRLRESAKGLKDEVGNAVHRTGEEIRNRIKSREESPDRKMDQPLGAPIRTP